MVACVRAPSGAFLPTRVHADTRPLHNPDIFNANAFTFQQQPHTVPFPQQSYDYLVHPDFRYSFAPNMADLGDEDRFAEYQGRDDVYQPPPGLPIGTLQFTADLVEEYRNADPNFQLKTQEINQDYPTWRKSHGDGGCGWRAIAFGYLELLLRLGDALRIANELKHLQEINRLMVNLGGPDELMVEEFSETTFDLMGDMQQWVHLPNRIQTLVDFFNDPVIGQYWLFYFKLLACTAMRSNPENYIYHLEDRTIEEYCTYLQVADSEIDDLANQALFDILLKPAGFGLEILDLNRFPGDNIYIQARFPEQLAGDGCVIRLLYRPGHYDLIYKGSSVQASSSELQSDTLPTNLVESSSNGSSSMRPDATTHISQQAQQSDGNLQTSQFPVVPGTSNFFSMGDSGYNMFTGGAETLSNFSMSATQYGTSSWPDEMMLCQWPDGTTLLPDETTLWPNITRTWSDNALLDGMAWLHENTIPNGLPVAPCANLVPSPAICPFGWEAQDRQFLTAPSFGGLKFEGLSLEEPPYLSLGGQQSLLNTADASAPAEPVSRSTGTYERDRANCFNKDFFPMIFTLDDGEQIMTKDVNSKVNAIEEPKKNTFKVRKGRD